MRLIKNIYILMILGFIGVFTSCRDDMSALEPDSGPSTFKDQNVLTFTVTLDAMGGDDLGYNPMRKEENYIDPEKFRVLFFDEKEQFLFESKSRWVKRESSDETSTVWFVSVPFYSYGNDENDDWDFASIREHLINNDFQIALLVNRPLHEYSSDYSETAGESGTGGVSGWFDNSGPHWKKHHSLYGYQNPDSLMKIFNLHHSQYDPVYLNKDFPNDNPEGYYDFIMDKMGGKQLPDKKGRMANPMMSSFTSWVQWEGEVGEDAQGNPVKLADAQKENFDHSINSASHYRKMVHPSEKHPIPMYGTQKFKKLVKWEEGTTFNLGRDEDGVKDLPISLLRSCVKVELIVPKSKGKLQFLTIWYSNICSRCEPMDVWTPTNEIWFKDGDPDKGHDCEMDAIQDYGPIFSSVSTGETDPMNAYRKRISWFYGSWISKGWTFGTFGTSKIATNGSHPYNRVFNPMTQRNNTISYAVDENRVFDDGSNYHYIIYTGERNINDPTNLSVVTGGNTGVGQRTLINLMYKFSSSPNVYSLPITDFTKGGANHPARSIQPTTYSSTAALAKSSSMDAYADAVYSTTNKNYRPLPLIRNHVYQLYLAGSTRAGEDEDFMDVRSEVKASRTITFPDAIKRVQQNNKPGAATATLDTSSLK